MVRWRAGSDAVVSYRLARQRALDDVAHGVRQLHEVCDAQPELRRVAHHHATPLDEPCPVCEGDDLVTVTFAFGKGLPTHGRCVTDSAELNRLRRRETTTSCYRVEVCRQCWWNHLRESFTLAGRPSARTAP